VVYAPAGAALFEEAFEQAFTDAAKFARSQFAAQWHLVQEDGKPPLHFCFSPHASSDRAKRSNLHRGAQHDGDCFAQPLTPHAITAAIGTAMPSSS
jgi:hypothetical protein